MFKSILKSRSSKQLNILTEFHLNSKNRPEKNLNLELKKYV